MKTLIALSLASFTRVYKCEKFEQAVDKVKCSIVIALMFCTINIHISTNLKWRRHV